MSLYYVKCDPTGGMDPKDNMDLFVVSTCFDFNETVVLAHWRSYYDLEMDTLPDQIDEIPDQSFGAIPWADVACVWRRPQ